MRILLICCLAVLFECSCNNPETNEPAQETTVNNSSLPDSSKSSGYSGCYIRVMQKDTLVAHLQQQGNNFTGRLTFNNYQKDGSTGTINGRLENGIIKLLYSFRSEGMNSVMEVYFKPGDAVLLPATGELRNHGDTVFFASPDSLRFAEKDRLQKTDCNSLPAKYSSGF